MGLELALEPGRSRYAAWLHAACLAVPAIALLLAAVQLAAGPTLLIEGPPAARGVLSAIAAGAGGLLAWRARIAARAARLPAPARVVSIDAAGRIGAAWRPGEAPAPAMLRACCVLPGLIVLVLAPYPGTASPASGRGPLTLVFGRDAVPDEAWRKLRRWLCWMERGRHEASVPFPDKR